MSTRRRVLLTILIIVTLVIGGRNLNKQELNHENQTESLSDDEMESFIKEMTRLNKELDRLIANADMTIKDYQRLPQPTTEIKKSYHDAGYENSWVQFVDEKEGLVQVETVESKITIRFRPRKEALSKFTVGPMAPVTIKCVDGSANCDLDPKHILYIRNGQVELVRWKFLRKTKRLKMK